MLFRKLIRDLTARAGLILALVVVMAIGVGVYIGLAGAYRDLADARDEYYRAGHVVDFQIDLKRLDAGRLAELRTVGNVKRIYGRVTSSISVATSVGELPIPGMAISAPAPKRITLNRLFMRTGTWFSDSDAPQAIVNHRFASAHGIRPGSVLTVKMAGISHRLTVTGTARSAEFVYLIPPGGGLAPDPDRFALLYLPEDFLARNALLGGAVNQLVGTVIDRTPAAIRATMRSLARRMDDAGVLRTTSAEDLPSRRFLADELRGLAIQSWVLPAIFLGVAALVLGVLLNRLVGSQRVVIGTLRALGYSSARVTRHYLAFGIVVGIMGGVAGVLLGVWLEAQMISVYRQYFALPGLSAAFRWQHASLGFAIGVLGATVGAYFGVRNIARLQPADAMRPAQPETGRRIALESATWLWSRLGFGPRMVLRGLFRNPLRGSVNSLAAATGTALIVAALALVASLDALLQHEFREVAHEDYAVNLDQPRDAGSSRELQSLRGVLWTEGQLQIEATLSNGPRVKRVSVIGLDAGTALTTPLDADGRPVAMLGHGLILARKLAQVLDVAEGDSLAFRPLSGTRERTVARVARIVETYLGLTAYADRRYLSELIGERSASNTLLVKLATGGRDRQFERDLVERGRVVSSSERRAALTRLEATFGDTMGAVLAVLVIFAGLIAVASIVNLAFVNINAREREIGIFRVLGYTPRRISAYFASESLLLAIAGIAFGCAVGVGLAYALAALYSTELYRFPAEVRITTIVASAAAMLAFVLLAEFAVFRLISKLDWLRALNARE